ncbi:MAG: protein translocase subunit SecD [Patescibacteria group bacterium]
MKVRILALTVLIVGALAGYYDWTRPFHLGLDLQGGTHLVYEADTSSVTGEENTAMESLRDVIERRVNLYGVSEPIVQTQKSGDSNRLIVELAGVFDISEALKLIGETPFLEFKEIPDSIRSAEKKPEQLSYEEFIATELTGKYVKRAAVAFDQIGSPQISLEFTSEGGDIFEKVTERNVGFPLAVFLDKFPISAPIVQQKISGGQAQITGQFTIKEAKELVGRFNAGALPVPISLLSQQSVGASLGHDSLSRSLRAGIWGTLAVALFMLFWYRLPGIVSVLALVVYAALTLFLFKTIPVTLSSAGIAGFILSIGMAIDANILIFERMKEELREGKNLDIATFEGFRRAWTSIRDSNVSSLITAFILYWFGTSLVKGFALTLGIGVLVSMFSAITASRLLLKSLPRFTSVASNATAEKLTRLLYGTGFSR